MVGEGEDGQLVEIAEVRQYASNRTFPSPRDAFTDVAKKSSSTTRLNGFPTIHVKIARVGKAESSYAFSPPV